jgi:multidrug resistance protein, MATE family
MSISIVNLIFVGMFADTKMMAGFGLAMGIQGILGIAVLQAVICAQETLVSQAYGGSDLKLCGTYLNRGRFVLFATTVPFSLLLFFSEHLFVALKQDPEVAYYAGIYLRVMTFNLFLGGQFQIMKKFLIQMQITWAALMTTIIASCLHVLWLYVFIIKMEWHFFGIGIAMATTSLLQLVGVTAIGFTVPRIQEAIFCP